MVSDPYENGEEISPPRPMAPPQNLIHYYKLPIDVLISKAKDRYELVMKAARIARELNASRLRYGVPRPEKTTVVSLNEILEDRILESRKPEDQLETAEEEVE